MILNNEFALRALQLCKVFPEEKQKLSTEKFNYLDQRRIRSEQGRMKFYVFPECVAKGSRL